LAAAGSLIAVGCQAAEPASDGPSELDAYMAQALQVDAFRSAEVDLNGDGRLETVVYATNLERCGTGGCALFVLKRAKGSFELVSRTTITKLPVRLLGTSTNGWRDLAVTVSGGGIMTPYVARLPFDGAAYAINPTVPPAGPLQRVEGTVLIGD